MLCEDWARSSQEAFDDHVREIVRDVLTSPIEVSIRCTGGTMPTQSYETDAAWDLYVLNDIWCPPGAATEVPTGIFVDIPKGFEGELKPRSGWGKEGLFIHHGVYDAGYQGELSPFVHNYTFSRFELNAGERICQFMLRRVVPVQWKNVSEFEESLRGTKGHGSTGR